MQKNAYFTHFEGSLKVVDDKELNPDVKIKFKLDDENTNKARSSKFHCHSDSDGFSKDQFECTNTNNNDEIWVKVKNLTGFSWGQISIK